MFLFGNKSWLPPLRVQWVLGALVAMLPLLWGVFYAAKIMDQHNRAQSHLVILSGQVSTLGATVADQTKDLERVFRQYQLLQDDRFKSVFQQQHSKLVGNLNQLQGMLESSVEETLFADLFARLATIESALQASTKNAASINDDFKFLHARIKTLNGEVYRMLRHRQETLETSYQDSQWRLLVMGAWVLPGTLILVWLVSVMVLRPIDQLSSAIKQMGKGDWRTDIHITGSNEMVLLGENLAWMQTQLQTIESQKHAFLQQVTHELKTPLAAIMEAGSLLADEVPGKLRGNQRQVLTILQDNANNLQMLIQQLLDYNSASKEHVQQLERCDLEDFFHDKLADLKGLAEARQVRLTIEGEKQSIPLDTVRMAMVVRNLVSNAVNLTPSGKGVVVAWYLENDHWCLSVEDEGPGVDEENISRLFEPFYQGGAKKQGSLKGSGIGLAIVKECVELMNGEIQVSNRAPSLNDRQDGSVTMPVGSEGLGKRFGACFHVRLPLVKGRENSIEESAVSQRSNAGEAARKSNELLVGDNA